MGVPGIIGLVVLLVGGILLYSRRKMERKTALTVGVATSRAADVANLPPGELVEVKGVLRCESPLTGELSGLACAYYSSAITREYEDRRRDSNGEWRTDRRSESVAANKQQTAFLVEDESGSVRVNPENADVDAHEVVDRFEHRPSGGLSVSLGGPAARGRRLRRRGSA